MISKRKSRWIIAIFINLSLFLSGSAYSFDKISFSPEKVIQRISSLGFKPTQNMIVVDTKKQILALFEQNKVKKTFTISTGTRGLGQQANTFKTPVGLHRINEKIGEGVPKYGIFHKRRYIGHAWKPISRHKQRKDFISTRIIRLEGLQPGFNKGRDGRGRSVDTENRGVYIHGTTMEWKLGKPSTKGCVHMSAKDVIALFNEVPNGTLVWIN